MRVLSAIEKRNWAMKQPGLNELLVDVNISRKHMDYLLMMLLEKAYIDKVGNPSHGFSITTAGSTFIRWHRAKTEKFANAAKKLFLKQDRQKLYEHISYNRNLFWFAYYDGFLTKQDLSNFTSLLDMEMKHFFWGRKDEAWADFYNRGHGTD